MSLPGQVASVEEETRQAPSWGLRRNHYGLAKAERGDESGWRRAVVIGAESPCGNLRNPCFGWLRPPGFRIKSGTTGEGQHPNRAVFRGMSRSRPRECGR